VATPAVRETSVAVPLCCGCRERDARIANLEQQVAALQAKLGELGDKVRRNASNSSIPPSTNPPDAPKPTTKKPTGRKRGGQPGHVGHTRPRLPPERVQHIIPFVPLYCDFCEKPLPETAGPNDPEPTWHQYAELPKAAAVVTEFQGHARTCSCGHVTRALIPEEFRRESIGPRLGATLSYLSGSPHVSKRGIEEICETVFQVPISLGTIKNLEQEIARGAFRQDLFYRLNVIPFLVPPLRDRKEDIPILARYFLNEFSSAYGKRTRELSETAMEILLRYPFPGNVRELRNLVERLVIVCPQARIEPHHLPPELFRGVAESPQHPYNTLHEARSAYEREFILRKLQENRWNMTQTATALGLERSHLYRKMKSLGIAAPD